MTRMASQNEAADRLAGQLIAGDKRALARAISLAEARGPVGGLSRAASDAADLLDAAGYDLILLETVGVGQDEVEVIEAAQTVVVVLVPGLGDDIQAIKAGLMEIADIYVINKSDREGA